MFGLFNFGGGEVVVILALILVLFGAKKIPELAKGLGQGIKEFKKATREVTDEIHNAADDSSAPPAKRIAPQNTQPAETAQSTNNPKA